MFIGYHIGINYIPVRLIIAILITVFEVMDIVGIVNAVRFHQR